VLRPTGLLNDAENHQRTAIVAHEIGPQKAKEISSGEQDELATAFIFNMVDGGPVATRTPDLYRVKVALQTDAQTTYRKGRSGCRLEGSITPPPATPSQNARPSRLARFLRQNHQRGSGVVQVAGRAAVQAAVALARVGVAGFRVAAAVVGVVRQILAVAPGAGVTGFRGRCHAQFVRNGLPVAHVCPTSRPTAAGRPILPVRCSGRSRFEPFLAEDLGTRAPGTRLSASTALMRRVVHRHFACDRFSRNQREFIAESEHVTSCGRYSHIYGSHRPFSAVVELPEHVAITKVLELVLGTKDGLDVVLHAAGRGKPTTDMDGAHVVWVRGERNEMDSTGVHGHTAAKQAHRFGRLK